jgi:GxxExxY protein
MRRQVAVPVRYDAVALDVGYRLDLLADDQLIVELKCVERLDRVHLAQVMTYLRLSGLRVGLLINFNEAMLKNGLRRIVNRYDDPGRV